MSGVGADNDHRWAALDVAAETAVALPRQLELELVDAGLTQ
jgi:hypothetical protein